MAQRSLAKCLKQLVQVHKAINWGILSGFSHVMFKSLNLSYFLYSLMHWTCCSFLWHYYPLHTHRPLLCLVHFYVSFASGRSSQFFQQSFLPHPPTPSWVSYPPTFFHFPIPLSSFTNIAYSLGPCVSSYSLSETRACVYFITSSPLGTRVLGS